jgi:hypothetical protein
LGAAEGAGIELWVLLNPEWVKTGASRAFV